MRNKLLLTAFLAATAFGIAKPEKSSAQIDSVTVTAVDSGFYACGLPSSSWFYCYGNVWGTPPSPDSVTVHAVFGDGSDTTYKVPESGQFGMEIPHTYYVAGTYYPVITITTSDNHTATANVGPEVVSNSCATLQGNIYTDLDASSSYNSGDGNLPYMTLQIVNTSQANAVTYTWTDWNGHYATNLATGDNYTVTPMYNTNYWYYSGYYGYNSLTPANPNPSTLSITNLSAATTQDFGYNCNTPTVADSVDLSVYGWGQHFAAGDSGYIYLSAGDYWWDWSCNGIDATVTLTLDSHLTYAGVTSGPAPTTVSGQTLTWNLNTISVGWYNMWAQIKVNCDASVQMTDVLCSQATITPNGYVDPYTANNTFDICHVANASWDPNGMQVAPDVDAIGTIANGTPLEYMIEFQNTGTAPAANIVVSNMIDANLDLSTLKVIKSSDTAVQVIHTTGQEMRFSFQGINLPDQSAGEAASTGFIVYRILPKQSLAAGTQLHNSANIYFDYNDAVPTNITLNTIESPTGVQHVASSSMKATVYPNPAGDNVTVKTDDKSEFTVTMSDMLGRVVAAEQSVNGIKNINTHSIPSGLYLVNVKGAKGGDLTTKVTVQH